MAATSYTAKDATRTTKSFLTITSGHGGVSGDNVPGKVSVPHSQTDLGLTKYRNIDLDETGVSVTSSATNLYGWYLFNAASAIRYVKLYNKATAATVGTDTPYMTIPLPAGGGANVMMDIPIPFTLGLSAGATTGVADNNTGAPAANEVIVHLFYKAA
jgi:hypothetical protein